jgi:hypothetical protein
MCYVVALKEDWVFWGMDWDVCEVGDFEMEKSCACWVGGHLAILDF